jgi:hypothetical protein
MAGRCGECFTFAESEDVEAEGNWKEEQESVVKENTVLMEP